MIHWEDWTPSGGITLEPNAERAARATESVAVMAGPGAGKTELLAQRAGFLLRTGICPYPRRILAVAFKRDAARNLKERVRLRCGSDLANRLDSLTFHAFAKGLIDRFLAGLPSHMRLDPDYSIDPYTKIEGKVIDFGDLVPYAEAILNTNPHVCRALRATYSHVFLDEFQDCTGVQYSLIRTAFRESDAVLTAVGDTKQRIMSWAGALEGIFIKLATDFDARALNLYQNFRAAPQLRRIQNVIVRRMDPMAALDEKEIQGEGGECQLLVFRSSQEEAERLAQLIQTCIAAGIPKHEIAVLTRIHSGPYSAELRAALARRGIEARDENELQDLLTEEVALLLLDFLAVLLGDRAAEAYHRLTSRVSEVVSDGGEDEERDFKLIRELNALVTRHRGLVDPDSTDDAAINRALDEFLDLVGHERLRSLSPAYQQGDLLSQLVDATRAALCQARSRTKGWRQAVTGFGGSDTVPVMTIHKSKGLEFDTVILLGLEDQAFFDFKKNRGAETSAFFVALSRAKRRIVISVCQHRTRPDGVKAWREERSIDTVKALFDMLQEAGVSPE